MYDTEQVIEDIVSTFQSKLDNEITNINTRKNAVSGDARFLESIASSKYVFETVSKQVLNFKDGFILYGLVDVPMNQEQLGNGVETTVVTFQVALFDKGEKGRTDLLYKLLRYRSALKEVVKNSPDMFRGFATPLITGLKPSAFEYEKQIIFTCGIDISASVTSV